VAGGFGGIVQGADHGVHVPFEGIQRAEEINAHGGKEVAVVLLF
jgi:hypothetical protein